MLDSLIERFPEEEFLKADGFDDALIGVDELSMRLIYSVSKCIAVLTERDGLTEEEAWEYFEFNVRGVWVGDKTPIWCTD
jgi:hypothetical protein